MTFPILGGNSAVGGYAIDNSLRFEQSYLSRTPSSSTTAQRQKFTFSFWMKKRYNADNQYFIIAGTVLTNDFGIYLSAGHNMNVMDRNSGGYHYSNRVLRDDSAWYHICVCVDTTESTAQDRCKIWINGELDSVMYTAFTLNNVGTMNGTYIHYIGQRDYTTNKRFTGYMAEVYMVAGQALTYADFTEFDENSGILKPKEYKGTLTGNSFYLDFENSGSLGADVSGLGNNWTPTNLASTDQTTDTPTNNFATINSTLGSGLTISEGNTLVTVSPTTPRAAASTFSLNTGKWYCEVKFPSTVYSGATLLGVEADDFSQNANAYGNNDGVYYVADGTKLIDGVQTSYGASFTTNDIIGIALNLDDNEITFYKNGASQGAITTKTFTGGYYFIGTHGSGSNSSQFNFNFGNPSFSITSGNSDQNGYGNFEYAPPSGYLALCTQNIATVLSPTIDDGSAYFHTQLYAGTGSTNAVTNDANAGDFQPDWLWIKNRSATSNHYIIDSNRGDFVLYSNLTNSEDSAAYFESFDTDGFTVSGNTANANASGNNFAAWQWKANGGTTSSNTDGTITSTVQANTTAGFSIVTYTGTGSNATVGHGLGKSLDMILVKNRSAGARGWVVWHNALAGNEALELNTTDAKITSATSWNSTVPTSSVFSVGTRVGTNESSQTFVAYCFAEIEGYSKFGSFTGNGNNDGVMVTTMFRPSFVMIKRTDSTQNWFMQDIARNTYNVVGKYLRADTSDTEGDFSTSGVDFISNGFKMRTTGTGFNASGGTYIYMAFAKNPFVSSTGIPVTAR